MEQRKDKDEKLILRLGQDGNRVGCSEIEKI